MNDNFTTTTQFGVEVKTEDGQWSLYIPSLMDTATGEDDGDVVHGMRDAVIDFGSRLAQAGNQLVQDGEPENSERLRNLAGESYDLIKLFLHMEHGIGGLPDAPADADAQTLLRAAKMVMLTTLALGQERRNG